MDDFWEPAKKQLLADAKGFMDSLVKFDKDNIPDRIIKKARKKGLRSFLFVCCLSPLFVVAICIDSVRKKSKTKTFLTDRPSFNYCLPWRIRPTGRISGSVTTELLPDLYTADVRQLHREGSSHFSSLPTPTVAEHCFLAYYCFCHLTLCINSACFQSYNPHVKGNPLTSGMKYATNQT